GQPDIPQEPQVLLQRQAEGRRPLPDLERREGVHVQVGELALDRPADIEVVLAGEARMDAALEADLDGAAVPGLAGAPEDLLEWHEVGSPAQVGGELPLREGAEATPEIADVRVIDVARDDVGHDLAGDFPAQVVGGAEDRAQVAAAGLEELRDVLLVELALPRLGEDGGDHSPRLGAGVERPR